MPLSSQILQVLSIMPLRQAWNSSKYWTPLYCLGISWQNNSLESSQYRQVLPINVFLQTSSIGKATQHKEDVCRYHKIQGELSIITKLTNGHKNKRRFTLLQGVILCCNLEFWENTSPWVRFLYLVLRNSVNECLNNFSKITKNKADIKKMIATISTYKESNALEAQFLQHNIFKDINSCIEKTFINKTFRSELKIIMTTLSHNLPRTAWKPCS